MKATSPGVHALVSRLMAVPQVAWQIGWGGEEKGAGARKRWVAALYAL